jgi:membrane associated rhomboid family serine protease
VRTRFRNDDVTMPTARRENLGSVFILLFLNIAFFLLEHQEPAKYARFFRFEWQAVLRGEVWRLATWQFTAAGTGWLEALALFVTLIVLYMMGTAIEEEWGTRHFMMLFVLSTAASVGVAAWLGITLFNTYFVYYTLLFVYATAFPQQTLYLFGVIPVRVRLIALVAFAALLYGAVASGGANVAALVGAGVAYFYYLTQRATVVVAAQQAAIEQRQQQAPRTETTAMLNAARHAAIRQASNAANVAEMQRLVVQCDRDAVAGVNICPPADYKPDATDGYCIRCEGFPECSARYLRGRVASAPMAIAPPMMIAAPVVVATPVVVVATGAPAPAPGPAPLA